jgi:acyl-CoA thioester hydrolase
MPTPPTPFISRWIDVRPDWIDYNNHLNMAYYSVIFDLTCDDLWDWIGFGTEYIANRNHTTFAVEFHIRYLRELKLGDRVRSLIYMVDHDDKRFHIFQELYHEDGWLAATGEGMTLHVNLAGPHVAPMQDPILSNINALYTAHATLPRPDGIGQKIGIRRKS